MMGVEIVVLFVLKHNLDTTGKYTPDPL